MGHVFPQLECRTRLGLTDADFRLLSEAKACTCQHVCQCSHVPKKKKIKGEPMPYLVEPLKHWMSRLSDGGHLISLYDHVWPYACFLSYGCIVGVTCHFVGACPPPHPLLWSFKGCDQWQHFFKRDFCCYKKPVFFTCDLKTLSTGQIRVCVCYCVCVSVCI